MPQTILLLQARSTHDPAKEEERASFAQKAGLPLEAVISHDLLQGPPSWEAIHAASAVMIGGSGEYYVSKGDLPFFADTLQRLSEIVAHGHPMFASCFGYQMLIAALGGEIVNDPAHMELGTYTLHLTGDGRRDPLFGQLPATFQAQMGHKDRATRLPPRIVNLCSSERSPFQAFRIPEKPIWATQFHPELSGEENRQRYLRYLDIYAAAMSAEEQKKTLEMFLPSPDTETLVKRFLDFIGSRDRL